MDDDREVTETNEWLEEEVERLDLRAKTAEQRRRSVRQDLHELTKRPRRAILVRWSR